MADWSTWVLGAWALVVLATGLGAAVERDHEAPTPPAGEVSLLSADHAAAASRPISDRATTAAPIAVEAPAVGLAAPLVPVAKTTDGALEVPDFGLAGWYEHSVRPGAIGAAVLAGHVDNDTGPDVFYALGDLAPGDEIVIGHGDGTSSVFVVDRTETADKDELPVERIFDHPRRPELRLITCGGDFDRSTRSYESNVIVYAHLQ